MFTSFFQGAVRFQSTITVAIAAALFGERGLTRWMAGLSGPPRTVAVIAAAVPTAATAYTIARKMGGDAELMAQIITFQSIASTATLPLFIWLAQSS